MVTKLFKLTVFSLLVLALVPVKTSFAQANQVEICHNGETQSVAEAAVPGHLGHGDTLGPCEDAPVVPEFGLVTGALAVAGSAGSYFLMKKRQMLG